MCKKLLSWLERLDRDEQDLAAAFAMALAAGVIIVIMLMMDAWK